MMEILLNSFCIINIFNISVLFIINIFLVSQMSLLSNLICDLKGSEIIPTLAKLDLLKFLLILYCGITLRLYLINI